MTGVADGNTYMGASVTINFSDANPVTAVLDGQSISSGTVVTAEGRHVLAVTDAAGNVRNITFCLHFCDET